jgi:hypothetical protein
MRKTTKLLIIGCVCTVLSSGKDTRGPTMSEDAGVTIEIMQLDVSDSVLTLSYKIGNGTDRDAWVCTSSGSTVPFEVFLASDKQTVLIRKRLDVPSSLVWDRRVEAGTYTRIAPGASLTDSVRVTLPVSPTSLYAITSTPESAKPPRHLALEVGYYDEDLPALVRGILAVAEKCGPTSVDVPVNLLDTYFRGLRVRAVLGFFDRDNKDPYGQGFVRIEYSRQALTGEKVLRADVNGVSIPFKKDQDTGN